jgi:hypothetical protein
VLFRVGHSNVRVGLSSYSEAERVYVAASLGRLPTPNSEEPLNYSPKGIPRWYDSETLHQTLRKIGSSLFRVGNWRNGTEQSASRKDAETQRTAGRGGKNKDQRHVLAILVS